MLRVFPALAEFSRIEMTKNISQWENKRTEQGNYVGVPRNTCQKSE